MRVRTRFAPSPTGYLHIGGVRTALFCWLFAKRQGGDFVLRIDDTDRQRNVEEALTPILDGLHWLGIDWDEGPGVDGPYAPYYQSQRTEHYRSAVEKLLAGDAAYYDYSRPEEIQEERDAAVAEKRTFVYSRRFMARTPDDRAKFEAEGRSAVVRLKVPREGTLVIDDLIRGRVEFEWSNEQDHVIRRADGSFLYHLANVVDDQAYRISHVIRAEEHLSNTPRQVFMIRALGYDMPRYAHLPCVAEPGSKTKLSKRKLDKYLKNKDFANLLRLGLDVAERLGLEASAEAFNPVVVDFYKQIGFLPEAIVNYMALVGWALDDKSEFFTVADLKNVFTLDRVTKGAASFDPKKLMAIQERHIQKTSLKERYEFVLPYLKHSGVLDRAPESMKSEASITALLAAAGDRIRIAGDIFDFESFFMYDDAFPYDEQAFEKRIVCATDPLAKTLLETYRLRLSEIPAERFTAEYLEKDMGGFLEEQRIKVAHIIHALRVATTGKSVGFGMFESLEILGKARTLARLDRTLAKLPS